MEKSGFQDIRKKEEALRALKDSTQHSRYFSDELGVQTDYVFTCAK